MISVHSFIHSFRMFFYMLIRFFFVKHAELKTWDLNLLCSVLQFKFFIWHLQ